MKKFEPRLLINNFDLLTSRLRWPDPLVRISAAQQIAKLISDEPKKENLDILISWLKSRALEIEVVAALLIIEMSGVAPKISNFNFVKEIRSPSIVSNFLVSNIFGRENQNNNWLEQNSGEPEEAFTISDIFEKSIKKIPNLFKEDLEKLEKETGLPFMRQWAWELNCFEKKGFPISFDSYHFIDGWRENKAGHFVPVCSDVILSAYIRTFSFACKYWRIPPNWALFFSLKTLPLVTDLAKVEPQTPPVSWGEKNLKKTNILRTIKSYGAKNGEVIIAANGPWGKMSETQVEGVEIRSVLDVCIQNYDPQGFWDVGSPFVSGIRTDNPLKILGTLNPSAIEHFIGKRRLNGENILPLNIELWPVKVPLWMVSIFCRNFFWPAPISPELEEIVATPSSNGVEFWLSGSKIGRWWYWLDNWSPVYLIDSGPRIGTALSLNKTYVKKLEKEKRGKLVQLAKTTKFNSERSYEKLEKSEEMFFLK